jgi:integrase
MEITSRKDAMIVLTALFGCRRSELLGLKYTDIDPYADTILFQRRVLWLEEKFDVSLKMKTETSRRTPAEIFDTLSKVGINADDLIGLLTQKILSNTQLNK